MKFIVPSPLLAPAFAPYPERLACLLVPANLVPCLGLKRCGKSCRLRWLNYLRPNIKHGGFTEEEENIICSMYIAIGSRWSVIATQLPGRTDNDIKNYWNTRLKKKLMARQKKEHAANFHTAGLLEQEMMKRESGSFLVNQSFNNQIPYWVEHPVGVPIMNLENHLYNSTQLMNNIINYNQYPTPVKDELYVGPSNVNGDYNPYPNMEYGVINGESLNTHHQLGEANVISVEMEAYLNNLLRFDGSTESQSGIDTGNSSTTSTSGGSTSWGEMASLVNTQVSSFEAYQNKVLQKVSQ